MPRIPNVTSTPLYFLDNCLFHFLNSFSLVRVFLFVSFIWGNGKVRLTHYLVFKYLTTMKSWNVDLLFHVEKVVVSKESSFFLQVHSTSTMLLIQVSTVFNSEGSYDTV